MTRNLRTVCVVLVLSLFATALSTQATLASWHYWGELTYQGGGLVVNPPTGSPWAANDSYFKWDITSTDHILWNYQYEFHAPGKALSHINIETTNPFAEAEILNLRYWDFDNGVWVPWTLGEDDLEVGWQKTGPGNLDMPEDLYGAKFQSYDEDALKLRWSFDAYRMPVWGDFYAKDGNGGRINMYNAGFLDADPTQPLTSGRDGEVYNHIIRPNGHTPGLPASALLGVVSLPLGLMWWRRRRR